MDNYDLVYTISCTFSIIGIILVIYSMITINPFILGIGIITLMIGLCIGVSIVVIDGKHTREDCQSKGGTYVVANNINGCFAMKELK